MPSASERSLVTVATSKGAGPFRTGPAFNGEVEAAWARERLSHRGREYFAVICSKCGNAAQVPFKPRMDKPVYCSDCFRSVQTA
jgi:CxxC-x17-CxxC domain-containing protein